MQAASRLVNGSERHLHPDVHFGDQTALWFAYVHAAPRLGLRVLALPEETLCAGEPLSSTHVLAGSPAQPLLQTFAYFRSSWVGPTTTDRRGVYRCHAVHGHRYVEEQQDVERVVLPTL